MALIPPPLDKPDPELVYKKLFDSGKLTGEQFRARCATYPNIDVLVRANDSSWDDYCITYEKNNNLGPYSPVSRALRWWLPALIVTGVVVAGATTVVLVRRRRRAYRILEASDQLFIGG
jgi:hypothetical protein